MIELLQLGALGIVAILVVAGFGFLAAKFIHNGQSDE